MNRIHDYLKRRSEPAIFAGCLALVGLILWADCATPKEIALGMFYWVPIAIATWFVGAQAGDLVAIASIAASTFVHYYDGTAQGPLAVWWLMFAKGVSLWFFVTVISRLREAFAREAESRRALEASREELERLVEVRTQHLESTVSQLRAFSYSVAHDLREPTRTVAAYSEILLDKAKDWDETSRAQLSRIHEAGRQMRGLLEGLLDLSRLSQEKPYHERVDLSAMARNILAEKIAHERGRSVDVRCTRGLEADGDRRLLQVLMQSLLDNAWKFTQGKDGAWIEVGCERREGENVYFVRDNGVGFEPAQAKQLFRLFRRLPSASGAPGLGIGLAVAARAVEAHGGRLWAEGAAGQGAGFFFTLAKAAAPVAAGPAETAPAN